VIEADEYDRSFLRLHPDIAIVSSVDPDHLDIYGTEEALQQAFIDFTAQLKPGGLLLKKFGLKRGAEMKSGKMLTYSLQNENADVRAAGIRIKDGGYQFNAMLKDDMLQEVALNMGGMHNVENVMAAIAVAHHLGIEEEKIKKAVRSFRGVKRRFEYITRNDSLVYIDDYAHHPEELKALITGAKALFQGKHCTVIFQPHLFSRTKDLANEFARSLDLADRVILLPIYPARELPVEGVTSSLILDKLENGNRFLFTKESVLDYIERKLMPALNEGIGEILITAGAGDIDMMVGPIKNLLENQTRTGEGDMLR
jgi:UDP-N-acetylmuramate--alanine ligase